MWNLLKPVNFFDVVDAVYGWRETTMDREDLIVNDCAYRDKVKDICKHLPYLWISILLLALSIEAIDLSDLPCLVVSAKKTDSVRVSDLVKQQESHRLNAMMASINIVSEEQVVDIRNVSSNFEHLHHVPELSVDISN
jgi:hypothetical protein